MPADFVRQRRYPPQSSRAEIDGPYRSVKSRTNSGR
jgi:hypothetical protein